jgi:hypothetical protein
MCEMKQTKLGVKFHFENKACLKFPSESKVYTKFHSETKGCLKIYFHLGGKQLESWPNIQTESLFVIFSSLQLSMAYMKISQTALSHHMTLDAS